ncbi:hypothetical protein CyaNS01_00682 [Cyanobium sp. NS01]|nr:hypothetical protein CyaNS01_00682 [Cyanobium sp. NS01]
MHTNPLLEPMEATATPADDPSQERRRVYSLLETSTKPLAPQCFSFNVKP